VAPGDYIPAREFSTRPLLVLSVDSQKNSLKSGRAIL
jgi:hypothetical protein